MPNMLQRLAWLPIRALMALFCSLEVRGVRNIQAVHGHAVIASNHSSEWDPLLIVASLPFFSRHLPLFFASREKGFYAGMGWKRFIYGGRLFRAMGAFQAYAGLKDYGKALSAHLDLIAKGKTVCIFPSGKRVLPGELAEAKGGVSFLARETGLPIIPVHIKGAARLTFRDLFRGKRKITVIFGEPIYAGDIFEGSRPPILDDTRNDYARAAAVLLEKIDQLA